MGACLPLQDPHNVNVKAGYEIDGSHHRRIKMFSSKTNYPPNSLGIFKTHT